MNRIEECDGYLKVYFNNRDTYFLCDKEDLALVQMKTWWCSKHGYAFVTLTQGKHVPFHIMKMGKKEGLEIDHINRNRLDNRSSNLRFVSHADNLANHPRACKYGTGIQLTTIGRYGVLAWDNSKKKKVYLGTFDTQEEAQEARAKFYQTKRG